MLYNMLIAIFSMRNFEIRIDWETIILHQRTTREVCPK